MNSSTADTVAVRQASRTVTRFEGDAKKRPEVRLPSNQEGNVVCNAVGNRAGNGAGYGVGNRVGNRVGNAVCKK